MSDEGDDAGWDLDVPGADSEAESFDWGEPSEAAGTGPDVIRWSVGDRLFAIEAEFVDEVISPLPVTDVPRLPDHILGVALRRRRVVGVVDVAKLLTIDPSRSTDRGRLLVTTVADLNAALLVDEVTGLELWPEDSESEKLLEEVEPGVREFAVGARWAPGGVVVLLDVAHLLDAASVR